MNEMDEREHGINALTALGFTKETAEWIVDNPDSIYSLFAEIESILEHD
jgi:hypothetical protein